LLNVELVHHADSQAREERPFAVHLHCAVSFR